MIALIFVLLFNILKRRFVPVIIRLSERFEKALEVVSGFSMGRMIGFYSVLVFISVIIYHLVMPIHELGHLMAAKYFNFEVQYVAIGDFDKEIIYEFVFMGTDFKIYEYGFNFSGRTMLKESEISSMMVLNADFPLRTKLSALMLSGFLSSTPTALLLSLGFISCCKKIKFLNYINDAGFSFLALTFMGQVSGSISDLLKAFVILTFF